MRCGIKTLLTMALACAALPAMAQTYPATHQVGRTPTPEEIASWNIAIGPDGRELPPGSGTSKEGAPIFEEKCAVCHGKNLENPTFGPLLVGGHETLTSVTPVKTVGGYYPFATSIWDNINRAMPLNKPGSLTPNEVYALTALILYRNDIIKEDQVMDAKSLSKVQMPNRHGFFPESPQYKKGYLHLWFWPEPRPQSKAAN